MPPKRDVLAPAREGCTPRRRADALLHSVKQKRVAIRIATRLHQPLSDPPRSEAIAATGTRYQKRMSARRYQNCPPGMS